MLKGSGIQKTNAEEFPDTNWTRDSFYQSDVGGPKSLELSKAHEMAMRL